MNTSVIVGSLLVGLAFYVYYAYSLMIIADKTHTTGSWMAWLPVFNIYLMCKIASKAWWWLLLILFVPVVNIVLTIILWMRVAEARGFPSWWGVLMILPFVNLVVLGYLAFAEHHEMPSGTALHH